MKNKTYFVFPTTSNPHFPTFFCGRKQKRRQVSLLGSYNSKVKVVVYATGAAISSGEWSRGRERFGAPEASSVWPWSKHGEIAGIWDVIHELINRDSNSDLYIFFFLLTGFAT